MLQAFTFAVGLLTLILAAMSFLLGAKSPAYGSSSIPEVPALESNLRLFGGIGMGLGLMLLWTVRAIEKRTAWFRYWSSASPPVLCSSSPGLK